jgi:hypothetical protein
MEPEPPIHDDTNSRGGKGDGKGSGKSGCKTLFVVEGWSDIEGELIWSDSGSDIMNEVGFWVRAVDGIHSAEKIDGLVMTWFVDEGGDGGYWQWSREGQQWSPVRAAHDGMFVWLPREHGEGGTGSGIGEISAGHRERGRPSQQLRERERKA